MRKRYGLNQYSDAELLFIRDNAHNGIKWLVAHMYNRSAASITNRSWRSRISIRKGGPSLTAVSIERRKATTMKHWAKNGACTFPKKLGWKSLRKIVMERDKWLCVYCGRQAEEVDHVIPRHMGGHNYPSNLVAACKKCNHYKSSNCVDCPEWRKKRGIISERHRLASTKQAT